MSNEKPAKDDLRGGYFRYCQWCEYDGNCALRHCEFMGIRTGDQVDKTPYPGHEDLRWGFSTFQKNHPRSACNGRIKATGSIFLPLACECGTVISGVCCKMKPSEKHRLALAAAQKIAKEKGIEVSEVDSTEFSYPEFDPLYKYISDQY